MKSALLAFLLSVLTMNFTQAAFDMEEIRTKLKSSGVSGEIHGASEDANLFVLTLRNPQNFFENIQLPLTSDDPSILSQLKNLKRHQYYNVKGDLIDNKAPIKHIAITELSLVRDYKSELDQTPHQYKAELNELLNLKEITVRVHAQNGEGKVLVVEYKDRILPVVVMEPPSQEIVKTLYRGDLVKIRFTVRQDPDRPMHLALERIKNLGTNEQAVTLIESLVKNHGQKIQKTGYLVKFPKSPQIMYNIYALLQEDANGTNIQYTLVNFENTELFQKIREKLETAWNDHAKNPTNDRNKLIARNILVTASGDMNMVEQGQANPQILISDLNDLKISLK